jgi:hypothetical protein
MDISVKASVTKLNKRAANLSMLGSLISIGTFAKRRHKRIKTRLDKMHLDALDDQMEPDKNGTVATIAIYQVTSPVGILLVSAGSHAHSASKLTRRKPVVRVVQFRGLLKNLSDCGAAP